MPTALTLGTFDIPHLGHLKFLKQARMVAKALRHELVIGVNTDAFVATYKGRTLFSENERMEYVREFTKYRHRVVLNSDHGKTLIGEQDAKLLIIGSDWLGKDYLGQIGLRPDEFTKWGITLVYVPYTAGISTSIIKERIVHVTQQDEEC